jgi:glycerol-3-phosphate dehydrogenase subunit B
VDDLLVVGAGPAGLLAAWLAAQQGRKTRLIAKGIGTTHLMPGWLDILSDPAGPAGALPGFLADHPQHPYALAGLDALEASIIALRQALAPQRLRYVGDLLDNFALPTALGTIHRAALVPESMAAGDLRHAGANLIVGPCGWREFYPALCADNLQQHGYPARSASFDLYELHQGKFDVTPGSLARLFDDPEVRQRVAAQLHPVLAGVDRVGFPAILGLNDSYVAWQDMQYLLERPVFEIPTLPPSVPGMRLYAALKAALTASGVPITLDMPAIRGWTEADGTVGVAVQNVVRETVYRAHEVVLATGGLYGGGILTDHRGEVHEAVYDLALHLPGPLEEWFSDSFLGSDIHPVHQVGVRVNHAMQPIDESGAVTCPLVRVAGRLLSHADPVREGSTEGIWLCSAYRAIHERQ